jgi:hypothetical protein
LTPDSPILLKSRISGDQVTSPSAHGTPRAGNERRKALPIDSTIARVATPGVRQAVAVACNGSYEPRATERFAKNHSYEVTIPSRRGMR